MQHPEIRCSRNPGEAGNCARHHAKNRADIAGAVGQNELGTTKHRPTPGLEDCSAHPIIQPIPQHVSKRPHHPEKGNSRTCRCGRHGDEESPRLAANPRRPNRSDIIRGDAPRYAKRQRARWWCCRKIKTLPVHSLFVRVFIFVGKGEEMTAIPLNPTPEVEAKIIMIASVIRSIAVTNPRLASCDDQALLETLLETRSSFLASSEKFPLVGRSWEPRLVRD